MTLFSRGGISSKSGSTSDRSSKVDGAATSGTLLGLLGLDFLGERNPER